MFNRLFSKGEESPASPGGGGGSSHPRAASSSNNSTPESRRGSAGVGGLLSPFTRDRGGSLEHTNGGVGNLPPSMPQDPQQRSWSLGGLLGTQSVPEQPSPGSIRRLATSLLRTAPPPLSAGEGDNDDDDDGGGDARVGYRDIHDEKDEDENINESLELTIQRRDMRIANLQSEIRHCQSQLQKCARDDHALRRGLLESTYRHTVAVKLWRRTNAGLRARVECFEQEATPSAAREIANLIRDAAPPNKDSAYLMMLQDQLSKATTKLEHLGSQTEIVLHKGEEVVESLREEMNEVLRERCRMELELLDQERMLEDDMRRMVVRTERRLRRVQGEIDYLEKNAMETLKKQEEEEEDEGEDVDDDEGNKEGRGDECTGTNCKTIDEEEQALVNGDTSHHVAAALSEIDTAEKNVDGAQKSPEVLRKELRTLAMERDRTLSVLQKKLRQKNEEYHTLLRLKEVRVTSIDKLEAEIRDREEWARVKQCDIP